MFLFSRAINGKKKKKKKTDGESPVTRHGEKKIFIFKELELPPYVFVLHDAIGGSLQPQYDGTFKVIKRNEKN